MKFPTAPLLFLAIPSLAAAFVGGPCADNFNEFGQCICLKDSVCTGKWNGNVVTGTKGNWPCPYDDNTIHGCVISHCDGFFTGCAWTNKCQNLGPSELSHQARPAWFARRRTGEHWLTVGAGNRCPGDSTFRCCYLTP